MKKMKDYRRRFVKRALFKLRKWGKQTSELAKASSG